MHAVRTLAIAAGLGLLAVIVDNLPIIGGQALLVAASTGLSWGGAAVLVGAHSDRPRTAMLHASLLLLGSTTVYYAAIKLLGTRSESSGQALMLAAIAWGAAALASGPVLGVTGWFARRGSAAQRPLAWGVLGGVLLSQGVYLLARSWRHGLIRDALGMGAVLGPMLVVPVLVVVIGAKGTRLPLALATMIVVGLLGGVAWSAVVSLT